LVIATDAGEATEHGLASLPPAQTTAEAIAKAIRGEILAGRYRSGDKLRQVELAKRYQVSTTPVREAFGILQRQGLASVNAHRGATAVVPTIRDLEELYEMRIALECLAVEHAAVVFRPSDAHPLRAMIAQMQECRDPGRYLQLSHDFHMALYRLSGRERLVEMIEQLRTASRTYLQIYSIEVVPAGNAENEHDDMLAACEANDRDRAVTATRQDLERTVASVIAQLDRTPAGAPAR
jgi:DNA-binding GntR family transcriptional regulator